MLPLLLSRIHNRRHQNILESFCKVVAMQYNDQLQLNPVVTGIHLDCCGRSEKNGCLQILKCVAIHFGRVLNVHAGNKACQIIRGLILTSWNRIGFVSSNISANDAQTMVGGLQCFQYICKCFQLIFSWSHGSWRISACKTRHIPSNGMGDDRKPKLIK